MTVSMIDSVEAVNYPPNTQAAAAYLDGHFNDFLAVAHRFPVLERTGKLLSIAVTSADAARCLDIEAGDATPSRAGIWVREMLARKVWRPCLYANSSTMPEVRRNLVGIPRSDYRLWVADWTGHPHIPAGFDACQWVDAGPIDRSLTLDSFWPGVAEVQHAAAPHGLFHGGVIFDSGTGRWKVISEAGDVRLGGPDRYASVEVQVNPSTGHWRDHPMPWNAPPLGGPQ